MNEPYAIDTNRGNKIATALVTAVRNHFCASEVNWISYEDMCSLYNATMVPLGMEVVRPASIFNLNLPSGYEHKDIIQSIEYHAGIIQRTFLHDNDYFVGTLTSGINEQHHIISARLATGYDWYTDLLEGGASLGLDGRPKATPLCHIKRSSVSSKTSQNALKYCKDFVFLPHAQEALYFYDEEDYLELCLEEN